jgi:hypothetical protein
VYKCSWCDKFFGVDGMGREPSFTIKNEKEGWSHSFAICNECMDYLVKNDTVIKCLIKSYKYPQIEDGNE